MIPASVRTRELPSGAWLAEAEVGGRVLASGYGTSKAAALEALGSDLFRGYRDYSAAIREWSSAIFRADPWREWRVLWRRVVRCFRRRKANAP